MPVVPCSPGSLPDPAVTGWPGLAPFPQPLQVVPTPDVGLGLTLFAGSLVLLLWASDVFVSAAERLGLSLGVSPYIVGATVVAGGDLDAGAGLVRARRPRGRLGVRRRKRGRLERGERLHRPRARGGRGTAAPRRPRADARRPPAPHGLGRVPVRRRPGRPHRVVRGRPRARRDAVYVHFTLSTETRLDEVVDELVDEYAEDGADAVPPTPEAVAAATAAGPRTYLALVGGLAVVFVAAELLVRSVLGLAAGFGVGTELVAVTAVAIGTSLLEVAVSVVAVRAGNTEIAIGGVLGSNVFNAFAVTGTASLLGPLAVPESIRAYALPAMLLVTLLYFFMAQDREMTAWEGVTLLVLYAAFLANLVRFT